MKRTLWVCFLLGCLASSLHGQFVLNGGFTSGTTNWGCTPELNPETVYGGSNGANVVAEIDNLVSLCQTINGLTVGTVYDLRYFASRRLGGCPGPNPANIGVSIAGLNTIDARSNSVWALTPSTYQFTATATSHTLNIVQQFAAYTTCGFIIDDIDIAVAIPFSMELSAFDLEMQPDGAVGIHWTTVQELNQRALHLEKGTNGSDWSLVQAYRMDEDSYFPKEYHYADRSMEIGDVYYRLQSIDKAGQTKYLGTRRIVGIGASTPSLSPNPSAGLLWIDLPGIEDAGFELLDASGRINEITPIASGSGRAGLDLSGCVPGIYALRIHLEGKWFTSKVVVQ